MTNLAARSAISLLPATSGPKACIFNRHRASESTDGWHRAELIDNEAVISERTWNLVEAIDVEPGKISKVAHAQATEREEPTLQAPHQDL
jgi:hypothetical protein